MVGDLRERTEVNTEYFASGFSQAGWTVEQLVFRSECGEVFVDGELVDADVEGFAEFFEGELALRGTSCFCRCGGRVRSRCSAPARG